ncbi:MAG: hypothetical protein EON48_07830 [Acetobacteraceae bacterium]|nr:MAG: hypothetical protein EON48_07830 [Acetobacteraceae bacterium]
MITSSISVPDDQHSLAKTGIRDGRFSLVSVVMHQGLNLFRQRDTDSLADRVGLRSVLHKRSECPFVKADDLHGRLAARRGPDGAPYRLILYAMAYLVQIPAHIFGQRHTLIRLFQKGTG